MTRHLHSLACAIALTALAPVRAIVGRSHVGLVSTERRIETRKRRLDQALARESYPLFVVLAVACLALGGCHGGERATRTALDVTAHAVASADSIVAREYTDAAQRELAAATDLDDYHHRMRRWDRAEEALRAVVQALYAAEAALDAADASGVRGALACVQTAAVDLLGALSALDVPIPQALARAVDTLGAFVGECHPPEAAAPGGTP